MKTIDRSRLQSLMQREQRRFVDERPKSKALFERARKSLLGGVPMNWMAKWAGAFPPFVREAQGAHFYDVDGHRYVDLCLGDTGAMTGHSPSATVKAVEEQVRRGITLMLPNEDAVFVGEELQKRFGLPYWQFALTATDANRFSIRLARQITGRSKILVFNWCYHGTVDETLITLHADGTAGARRGNIGPPVDPSVTTKVVEFNDVAALDQALAPGDVACVLAEPVMTNVGIVHPEHGYHSALRAFSRKFGTQRLGVAAVVLQLAGAQGVGEGELGARLEPAGEVVALAVVEQGVGGERLQLLLQAAHHRRNSHDLCGSGRLHSRGES